MRRYAAGFPAPPLIKTLAFKMDKLRIRFQEITDNGDTDSHKNLIQELRHEFNHTIETIDSHTPISRYTCAMHAFDLIENQEYIQIIHAAPSYVYASPSFIQRLISLNKLIRLPEVQVGALAVYFDNGCVKHIGKLIKTDRVESKWGIGDLYHHAVKEVPASYGTQVQYYEKFDTESALDEFVEYAKEHGVEFEC